MLIAADLVLAWAQGRMVLGLGVSLWGVHMGLTQGLLAAMVAGTAPAELRGTAYGVFNLMSGLAALAASVLAGVLWDRFGEFGVPCGRGFCCRGAGLDSCAEPSRGDSPMMRKRCKNYPVSAAFHCFA